MLYRICEKSRSKARLNLNEDFSCRASLAMLKLQWKLCNDHFQVLSSRLSILSISREHGSLFLRKIRKFKKSAETVLGSHAEISKESLLSNLFCLLRFTPNRSKQLSKHCKRFIRNLFQALIVRVNRALTMLIDLHLHNLGQWHHPLVSSF